MCVREKEKEKRKRRKRGRKARVQGNKGLCVNCKLIQVHSKPTTEKKKSQKQIKAE